MFDYLMGNGGTETWMGFCRLSSKSAYTDSSGRQWCLLSQEDPHVEWSGGLLSLTQGTTLVQRKKSKSCTQDIVLDRNYLDQPYTPELYDSASHIVGAGATWRLQTGGGYHRVRLHVVDWWHWPAKDGGAPRQFELWLHTGDGPGVEPQKHSVSGPSKGSAKVLEYLVHVEPLHGLLDVEIRSGEDLPAGAPQPCFSALEVMKVPREDVVPRGFSDHGVKTEFIKEALENPGLASSNWALAKKKTRWFPRFW